MTSTTWEGAIFENIVDMPKLEASVAQMQSDLFVGKNQENLIKEMAQMKDMLTKVLSTQETQE